MFMTAFITVVAAYLLGSVNFAVIFSRIFIKGDIREQGSGNAGTTNVMRVGGVLPGTLTFVCDFLKGFLAALLGTLMFSYIYKKTGNTMYLSAYGKYLCSLAVMIGHVFPVFFGFKGGKGVATGVGAITACYPISGLIAFGVFLILFLITKTVSVSSLSGTLVGVVVCIVMYDRTNGASFFVQAILIILMGSIIFLKHIPNIKRLLSGEEKHFKFRRK